MTDEQTKAEAVLRKAMARAFVLGQDWWAQADSESFRQNKKADITRARFDALVNETVAALSTPQPPPEAGSVDTRDVGKRSIYDQMVLTKRCAELAGPRLFHALRNLLDAVNERRTLSESIESIVLSDAENALLSVNDSISYFEERGHEQ
jgi:hypothetical protein